MIRISTDSTADLEQLVKQYDIPVMPLSVTLEGVQYLDGVNVGACDIFDSYDRAKVLPKTAARSISDYENFFSELTDGGNEVIHFAISSEISASFNNAVAAAKQIEGVYVIDSRSLSTGIGLLVLKAMDYREAGYDAKEIYEKVSALVPYVQASFVVDTMEYLHKGGRCNGLTAFFANALKLHPEILVKDGQMVVGKKYVGRMSGCLRKYVTAILKEFNTPDVSRVFVTHSFADPDVVKEIIELVKELRPDFKEVIETHAGCTITSHCGKGTLGILYINKAE